jgi:hypothetical protein
MLTLLSALFFVAGLVSAYLGIVRPALRQRGYFADFYARADSFWQAAADYVRGLRTKLAANLLMLASGLVTLHDFILPATAGIDWTPVYSLLPPWAWTAVFFLVAALFRWLRKVTTTPEGEGA